MLMHLYNVEQGLLSVNLSKGALYLTVGLRWKIRRNSCDKAYFLGQTAVFFIGAAICSSWPTRPLYWLVNEKLGEIHAIKLILTKRCCIVGVSQG